MFKSTLVWFTILFLNLLPLQPHTVGAYTDQPGIMMKRTGCNINKCGDVDIPYPFGIGPNCSYNHFFDITCNHSLDSPTPFLTALNLQVVNLATYYYDHVIYVSYPFLEVCSSNNSLDPPTLPLIKLSNIINISSSSPYILSTAEGNSLVVNGCNAGASVMARNGTILKGCTTLCSDDKSDDSSYCQTPLPVLESSMDSYQISLTILNKTANIRRGGSTCVKVGLGNDDMVDGDTRLPLSAALKWSSKDLNTSTNSNCTTEEGSESCQCMNGFRGNPYLLDACQVPEECKRCRGRCVRASELYNSTWDEDPNLVQYHCETKPAVVSRALVTGLCTSIGSVVLLLGSLLFYHKVNRVKEKRRRAKNFKKNGGLLLQQHLTSNERGILEKSMVFNVKELEKATDNFNKNRILGHGGQGTVYKGMLADGRIVAIKKAKRVDGKQSQQFINEVVILSQINHRNVVTLLGCCLETEVPLLVYEYVPNGMLSQHIHHPREDFHITWKMRLQIAVEIAGALAYLHSSSSTPIYHRDIKSSNILLDEKYKAKIADFGISRYVSIDQTHLTTNVVGTFGYLDPEYFRSHQFTEKSDVYSFGVVLIELITGKKPILTVESSEQKSLAAQFLELMEISKLVDILDPYVSKESKEELVAVANLATRCLNMVGINRPTMKEVSMTLEGIRHQQPWSLGRIYQEIEHGSVEASRPHNYKETSPSSSCTSSFFNNV